MRVRAHEPGGLAPRVRLPLALPDGGAVELAARLRRVIEGEVRFDDGDRALWATDASNYRQVPIGVVLPRHKDDIVATFAICRALGAPVLMRGGGTSLAGQCCNVAVVLDTSKYMREIGGLDPAGRRARVLPGTILDELRGRAAIHDLTFGPDPATHTHCTLGGMLGNNSCGPHSVMAGRTGDNVDELEIVTYDGLRMWVGPTPPEELARIIRAGGRRGEIYRRLRQLVRRFEGEIRRRYPDIPRRVSGYNLDQLLPERGFNVARALVGSEGTCAGILEAKLRLVPWPRARVLVVLGYPDVFAAADHVPAVMGHRPIALEGIDAMLIRLVRRKGFHEKYLELLPAGRAFLLVELGGDTREEARGRAAEVARVLRQDGAVAAAVFDDSETQDKIWQLRESGLGATARVPGQPDAWPGWEDSAVAPERLGGYLRDLHALMQEHGYTAALYGHFGQGCVHCRIDFDLTSQGGVDRYRRFVEAAADLVTRHGGSLSGEHGDGQSRAELLPRMYGPALVGAFREFKAIWDPEGKMNPGKLVDPRRLDEDLRLGPNFSPASPETHFQFPDDDGDLVRATLRCVGVGKCRRMDGGTMCPSYMVLGEEKHTTRGRAHLLFEMLRGEGTVGRGWRDERVKESLDLCLACKGCKGECPVNVDVATYKAEFFSHYYRRRLRPRAAYSMGLVPWWLRLAALAPGLANVLGQNPGLSAVLKAIGGIAPQRSLPPFPRRTFKQLFFSRPPRNIGGPPVILWPDTFNDHLFPETALAALEVLESAGFRVVVPRAALCCGRPLYDFGMLDLARRFLRRVVEHLAPLVCQGVPVVGLEPSCVSVFRDELRSLFPRDRDALRLGRQAFTFGEFLASRLHEIELPALERQALVHGHCHAAALWGLEGDRAVLSKLGVEHRLTDAGCCGMAGSFGYEAGEKYEVAIRAGERKLLPMLRVADEETLVVADGFSCREQVRQGTGHRPLHLAEVARMALATRQRELDGAAIPRETRVEVARLSPWKPAAIALSAAIVLAGGLAPTRTWLLGRPRRRAGRALVLATAGLIALGAAALGLAAGRMNPSPGQ